MIDQGIGIAPEDLPRIFDEFVQITKPDGDQGTGLGLPISQRLARLLGGALEAQSEPGAGSTFRLRLPASAATEEPSSDGKARRSELGTRESTGAAAKSTGAAAR